MDRKFHENIASISATFMSRYRNIAARMQRTEMVLGWSELLERFIEWARVFTEIEETMVAEYDWYLAMEAYVDSIGHYIVGRDELVPPETVKQFAMDALEAHVYQPQEENNVIAVS